MSIEVIDLGAGLIEVVEGDPCIITVSDVGTPGPAGATGGAGATTFAGLTDLSGSNITEFITTATDQIFLDVIDSGTGDEGHIDLYPAGWFLWANDVSDGKAYIEASSQYLDLVVSNAANTSVAGLEFQTSVYSRILWKGNVSFETKNYTSAGVTDLETGYVDHNFTTAPSGNVGVNYLYNSLFWVKNETATPIVFEANTTETFNGNATVTIPAGQTYRFKTRYNSPAYVVSNEGGDVGITSLTGDVTASGSGSVAATIANDAVTYAKMQNVSATDKVLGRSSGGSGDVEEIACTAAGRALLNDANAAAQVTTLGLDNTKIASIGITIDGGGSAITTGSKGYVTVPYACTINSATLLADQSGSIVIDVKKSTYAGFPTTSSIAASAKPTLTAVQKNTDATLTGWTTSVAAGDCIEFVVDSIATCTRVHLNLKVTKT